MSPSHLTYQYNSNNSAEEEPEQVEDVVEPEPEPEPEVVEEPKPRARSPVSRGLRRSLRKHIHSPTGIRSKCDEILRAEVVSQSSDGDSEAPKSIIFITRADHLYKLEFVSSNIQMYPLYVKSRYCSPQENEKKSQPSSQAFQVISKSNMSRTKNVLVSKQRFVLNEDQTSSMPNPVRVYTESSGSSPPSNKSRISERLNQQPNGVIYCKYKDILIRVVSPTLPICRTRMHASDAVLEKMKRLRMPSSESRKNKGQLVGRLGDDLLLLTFDMDEISLQQAEHSVSTAVQTDDRMVYIRERSGISGRSFLLALPESTYYYRNPMENIHRLHMTFMGTNIMPLWKYEMMRSRVDAARKGTETLEAEVDKAFNRTRGSRLFFEAFDSLLTVEGGMLCCDVDSGQDSYERMMCERDKPLPTYNSQHDDLQTSTADPSVEESSNYPQTNEAETES